MADKKTPTNNDPPPEKISSASERPKCGIIMPISAIDGLSEAHWAEVNSILSDAIAKAGFDANLVSSAEDVGIIQKTIIQNLYDNPVVVCDVSGKNPNVMFELGMRLAFDKPTIIVKDDKTSYSFDTSPIEHLNYPRDLRYSQIVDFKTKLADKVKSTHSKTLTDPNYTTFLKHFGEFKIAKIDQTEVSGQEYIIEELQNLRHSIARIERSTRPQITLKPREPRWHTFTVDQDSFRNSDALKSFLSWSDAQVIHSENNQIGILVPKSISPDSLAELERLISDCEADDIPI